MSNTYALFTISVSDGCCKSQAPYKRNETLEFVGDLIKTKSVLTYYLFGNRETANILQDDIVERIIEKVNKNDAWETNAIKYGCVFGVCGKFLKIVKVPQFQFDDEKSTSYFVDEIDLLISKLDNCDYEDLTSNEWKFLNNRDNIKLILDNIETNKHDFILKLINIFKENDILDNLRDEFIIEEHSSYKTDGCNCDLENAKYTNGPIHCSYCWNG